MASTRLRKTFHYPSSSDSDSEADGLDEEHQERLIAKFQADDAQRSAYYRNAFLSLPSFGILFLMYTSIVVHSARQAWITILSISSLASSAYILKFMPIKSPVRKGKRPIYQVEADKGPVERYIVILNVALAGLLLTAAFVSWSRGQGEIAVVEALPASK